MYYKTLQIVNPLFSISLNCWTYIHVHVALHTSKLVFLLGLGIMVNLKSFLLSLSGLPYFWCRFENWCRFEKWCGSQQWLQCGFQVINIEVLAHVLWQGLGISITHVQPHPLPIPSLELHVKKGNQWIKKLCHVQYTLQPERNARTKLTNSTNCKFSCIQFTCKFGQILAKFLFSQLLFSQL